MKEVGDAFGKDISETAPHGPFNGLLGSCDYRGPNGIAALGLSLAAGADGQLLVTHCASDTDQVVPGVGDSAVLNKKCGLIATKGDVVLELIGYSPWMGDRAADILGNLAKLALTRL